jgi:hypothetical protein
MIGGKKVVFRAVTQNLACETEKNHKIFFITLNNLIEIKFYQERPVDSNIEFKSFLN